MMRIVAVLAIIASVFGYQPANQYVKRTLTMSATQKLSLSKVAGIALLGASLFGTPVLAAVEPKFSFFGDASSSPFTLGEKREDPIYSPYSPYGDGSAAAYNERKNGKEEISFWSGKLAESAKRVDKVPGYVAKKTWTEITTELTRYTYDMRESMLRLGAVAKDSKAATLAAKTYFQDLNDIFEYAVKKNGDKVLAAYTKSKADLASFKALTN